MKKNIALFLAVAILLIPTNSLGMRRGAGSSRSVGGSHGRQKPSHPIFVDMGFGSTDSSYYQSLFDKKKNQIAKTEHRQSLPEETLKALLFNQKTPDFKTASKMVKWGANINSRYKDGYTLLHLAAIKNKPNIVKFLLKQGADANMRDKWNKEPIDRVLNVLLPYSYENEIVKKLTIAEYLIKHGADFYTPKEFDTPMKFVQQSFGNADIRPATAEFIINLGKFFIEQDKRNELDKMLTILNQAYAEYDNQSGQTDYEKIEENLKRLAFDKNHWYKDWYYAKFSEM